MKTSKDKVRFYDKSQRLNPDKPNEPARYAIVPNVPEGESTTIDFFQLLAQKLYPLPEDQQAFVERLQKRVMETLLEGESVCIEGLCSFYYAYDEEGTQIPYEITEENIDELFLVFKPDPELERSLNDNNDIYLPLPDKN